MANLVWPICIQYGMGQSVDAVFLFFSEEKKVYPSIVVSG